MSDESDSRSQGFVFVLAGVVLLLLLGGGAFFVFQTRQSAMLRAEREAAVAEVEAVRAEAEARRTADAAEKRQAVEAALTLASDLRKQYKFAEAAAALEQAEKLAPAPSAPELRDKVERAKADVEMLARLDAIRLRKSTWVAEAGGKGRFDTASAAPAYRAAFRAYGIDVPAAQPGQTTDRIKTSAIRDELVAALDDWAACEPDAKIQAGVLEIARWADPGRWLDQFRDPAVRKDRAKLEELAKSADVASLPPASVVALAELMHRLGLDPVPVLTAALHRHPGDFTLTMTLASLVGGGPEDRSVERVRWYQAAVALRPGNTTALHNLGVSLIQMGDAPGAIAVFREAIRLDPRNPLTHLNLGVALQQIGDIDGAIACFREALRLDPQNAQAFLNIGNALASRCPIEEGAIAAYREAIRLDPANTRAHTALGRILYAKGDVIGAREAFRRAVQLDPTDPKAYYHLGEALLRMGDIDGAVAAFRQAIRLDPKDAAPHAGLGQALKAKGDAEGAIACFREAARLDPKQYESLLKPPAEVAPPPRPAKR